MVEWKEGGRRVALFENNNTKALDFDLFDGQTTLGEIRRRCAHQQNCPKEQGFGIARDCSLRLAGKKVCAPANAPELLSDT